MVVSLIPHVPLGVSYEGKPVAADIPTMCHNVIPPLVIARFPRHVPPGQTAETVISICVVISEAGHRTTGIVQIA